MYALPRKRFGKIHIKKRPVLQWLAYFVLIMPFFLAILQTFLGLPGLVKYTIDIAWLVCIALLFMRRRLVFDRNLLPFMIFTLCFLLYTFVSYLFTYQSAVYYLWGMRNNFRFYFAFIIFAMLFTEEEADSCLKFMDILFWVNVVVSLFQFFVLGLQQDFLGGIFGIERGCNAYSIVFFSIVLSKSILRFMSKQENVFKCFFKCGIVLIIAAMAELKFFFIVFTVILFLSTILTSFSWQKFFLILLCAIVITFASTILSDLFGSNGDISFENIMNLITTENYSTEEDLSRFSAIPKISRSIMTNDMERIFGLGLGNCDTSTFAICNTPFYQIYADLHYNWFSSAFLFLETGFVGLGIFIIFFIVCLIFAINQKKKPNANVLYCNMAIIMSFICIMLTFYNASLRNEVAYMVYFVLALPLISSRTNIIKKEL